MDMRTKLFVTFWNTGFMGKVQQQNPNYYTFVRNHSGAKQFAESVQKYLLKNVIHVWCYFRSFFNIALVPLNTAT